MIELQQNENIITVMRNNVYYGTLELYDNPYHNKNCYVRFNLSALNIDWSVELFEVLQDKIKRPLQAMVSSKDFELCNFLTVAGFQCKRKCYEVEAKVADYIAKSGRDNKKLKQAYLEEKDYKLCCEMMYEYYKKTHSAINPWTSDFNTFVEILPEEVIYEKQQEGISALAFVEDNEISYIACFEKSEFCRFATSLITEMFEKHETIFFESDDCDWAAMRLRDMFKNQSDESYNTYVLNGRL